VKGTVARGGATHEGRRHVLESLFNCFVAHCCSFFVDSGLNNAEESSLKALREWFFEM